MTQQTCTLSCRGSCHAPRCCSSAIKTRNPSPTPFLLTLCDGGLQLRALRPLGFELPLQPCSHPLRLVQLFALRSAARSGWSAFEARARAAHKPVASFEFRARTGNAGCAGVYGMQAAYVASDVVPVALLLLYKLVCAPRRRGQQYGGDDATRRTSGGGGGGAAGRAGPGRAVSLVGGAANISSNLVFYCPGACYPCVCKRRPRLPAKPAPCAHLRVLPPLPGPNVRVRWLLTCRAPQLLKRHAGVAHGHHAAGRGHAARGAGRAQGQLLPER